MMCWVTPRRLSWVSCDKACGMTSPPRWRRGVIKKLLLEKLDRQGLFFKFYFWNGYKKSSCHRCTLSSSRYPWYPMGLLALLAWAWPHSKDRLEGGPPPIYIDNGNRIHLPEDRKELKLPIFKICANLHIYWITLKPQLHSPPPLSLSPSPPC
jgi:hypothetical protein